jgi:hypothetical protein
VKDVDCTLVGGARPSTGCRFLALTVAMIMAVSRSDTAVRVLCRCPLQSRTIGVITKPDAIPAGGHKDWLQIMQGQKLQLKLVRAVRCASCCGIQPSLVQILGYSSSS